MEPWRLVTTWDGAPGFNMALDEAFLLSSESRPTLRFYTWSPDTLSLGYFQKWEEIQGKDVAGAIVRRVTGGGAIHHTEELTYSIAANAGHPLFRGEVRDSYARIHDALAAAFAPLGIEATRRGDAAVTSDDEASTMCFHHSTDLDLVWGGAKGVGSAQRRSNDRVLHHGSIKLGTTELEGPIAVLRTAAPTLGVQELAQHLIAALTTRWNAEFAVEEPTVDELAHAAKRADFFTSRAHLERR